VSSAIATSIVVPRNPFNHFTTSRTTAKQTCLINFFFGSSCFSFTVTFYRCVMFLQSHRFQTSFTLDSSSL